MIIKQTHRFLRAALANATALPVCRNLGSIGNSGTCRNMKGPHSYPVSVSFSTLTAAV